jgi:hypothetical protein
MDNDIERFLYALKYVALRWAELKFKVYEFSTTRKEERFVLLFCIAPVENKNTQCC